MVDRLIPYIAANVDAPVLPRRLVACSAWVAQRQFSGEYGPSLSMRSIDRSADGRTPMSDTKFSNIIQRVQIVIPRPP